MDSDKIKEYLKENLRIIIESEKEYYSSTEWFEIKLVLEDEILSSDTIRIN